MTVSLCNSIRDRFGDKVQRIFLARDRITTVELAADHLPELAHALSQEAAFDFRCLIDLCGVDYLEYGQSNWRTEETTATGFSRGQRECMETARLQDSGVSESSAARFAVVYHLLSLSHNQRVRLRVFLQEDKPVIASVYRIWNAANWFEREAFDLFGIFFEGHPDLRRLLTDYGFVGHPFRKDFPLIGEVELRYDAAQQRCVYAPVTIQPRINVPKVLRRDNRYCSEEEI